MKKTICNHNNMTIKLSKEYTFGPEKISLLQFRHPIGKDLRKMRISSDQVNPDLVMDLCNQPESFFDILEYQDALACFEMQSFLCHADLNIEVIS